MHIPRIRYADVAATLALLLAGGGTAYAAGVLPRHSVGTAQLKTAAVTTPKLHKHAVTRSRLAAASVGSAAVENDSLRLADIAGADLTGTISLSFAANGCGNAFVSVPGAAVGQVAMMSWEGDSNPTSLMTGPARVSSAGHVVIPMCNVSGSSLNLTDVPVRVITLG